MEKNDQLIEASKKYELAIKFSNSKNERALNSLKRIKNLLIANKAPKSIKNNNNFNSSSSLIDVIELSDDDCDLKLKKNITKSNYKKNLLIKNEKSGINFKSNELNKNCESSLIKYSTQNNTNNKKNNYNLNSTNNCSTKYETDNRKKLREIEAFIAQLKRSK